MMRYVREAHGVRTDLAPEATPSSGTPDLEAGEGVSEGQEEQPEPSVAAPPVPAALPAPAKAMGPSKAPAPAETSCCRRPAAPAPQLPRFIPAAPH